MESAFQFKTPVLTNLEFAVNDKFNSEGKDSVKIPVSMFVNIDRTDDTSNEATVALKVEIGDRSDKCPYFINITEQAGFKWPDGLTEKQRDLLLNQNAPSLLLSYIRPVVAQTTAASEYGEYNIPFMNFTKKQ